MQNVRFAYSIIAHILGHFDMISASLESSLMRNLFWGFSTFILFTSSRLFTPVWMTGICWHSGIFWLDTWGRRWRPCDLTLIQSSVPRSGGRRKHWVIELDKQPSSPLGPEEGHRIMKLVPPLNSYSLLNMSAFVITSRLDTSTLSSGGQQSVLHYVTLVSYDSLGLGF